MANGLAPYILNSLQSVAGQAYPAYKIDLHGLTAMMLDNAKTNPVQLVNPQGHLKEARVWYRQRPTVAMTDTAVDCTIANVPARKEATISGTSSRSINYFLTDALVASYLEEASAAQAMPAGSTPNPGSASAELLDIIYSACNAIIAGVETDTVGLLSYGRNRVSGNSAAVSLVYAIDTTLNDVTKNDAKLLGDYGLNNLTGRPAIVGAGIMYRWVLQQAFKGQAFSGINTKIAAAMYDFYPSQIFDSAANGGSNNIAVLEPGSLHLVEKMEYTGFAGGLKPDGTWFFVMPVPFSDGMGNVNYIKFDVMLKYDSCPSRFTYTDQYSGGSVSGLTKGWNLMIKKDFGIFQTPSDAYRNDDGSIAVNGCLKYSVSQS